MLLSFLKMKSHHLNLTPRPLFISPATSVPIFCHLHPWASPWSLEWWLERIYYTKYAFPHLNTSPQSVREYQNKFGTTFNVMVSSESWFILGSRMAEYIYCWRLTLIWNSHPPKPNKSKPHLALFEPAQTDDALNKLRNTEVKGSRDCFRFWFISHNRMMSPG